MPFLDLEEALQELNVSVWERPRDGYIIRGPDDIESMRNYKRWYAKCVFYPKHRAEALAYQAEYYRAGSQDPEFMERRRQINRKSAAKRRQDPVRQDKRRTKQRERMRQKLQDPEYRAKHNERNRAWRKRKALTACQPADTLEL